VLVEVEDDGPGIPEEIRARIFEPFFTTRATGTGLGLAVVKRIMDLHGGEVALRPGPRGGAIFTLRFPVAGRPGAGGTGAAVAAANRMG
jgi:signal transduction histidine kinase